MKTIADLFRPSRAKIACVNNSRPIIICDLVFMIQITEAKFLKYKTQAIICLNEIVAHLKNNEEITLKHQKLDIDSLSPRTLANVLFTLNYDQFS